jgi:hypothetical protein
LEENDWQIVYCCRALIDWFRQAAFYIKAFSEKMSKESLTLLNKHVKMLFSKILGNCQAKIGHLCSDCFYDFFSSKRKAFFSFMNFITSVATP